MLWSHSLMEFYQNKDILAFPLWLSRLRIWLVSLKMWIWSLALLTALRIWHCCKVQCRSQMWLRSSVAVAVVQASSCSYDSTPAQELQYAPGVALKREKINKFITTHGCCFYYSKVKLMLEHIVVLPLVSPCPEWTQDDWVFFLCGIKPG